VWNLVRNFFWRTYRKKGIWLSEGALKRYAKQHFALHSDSVQAVIEKFCGNLKASRALRKENPIIRYPYKTKSWFCVHWKKKAIKVENRCIHLSNGKGRQGIVFELPAYLAGCQPRCVELIWRNGYWLSVTLDLPDVERNQQLSFNTAAVDMGEIHAMTITDGNEAIVISGRQLRSVKRNRNKRVAQLSKLQSRCKKGSWRFKRLQAIKSKVMAECHRRTRDLNHKITRLAVSWCIEHDIKKLVIGDVSGISKNTKKEKRLNKKNRQKISQWSFYQQRQYLQYKCEEIGIETVLESEHSTSKTCPRCSNKYKPTGRKYDCRNPECNLKMAVHEVTAERSEHRDVVGACNIRTKHLTGVLSGKDNFSGQSTAVHEVTARSHFRPFKSPTVKYLRPLVKK